MIYSDLCGNKLADADLIAPVGLEQGMEWATRIVDRCFSVDGICTAQLKLIEPLLTILLNADSEGSDFISNALVNLACVAGAICKCVSLPWLRLRQAVSEDVEQLAAEVVSEFRRTRALLDRVIDKHPSPTFASANLLLIASLLELRRLEDSELRKQMVAASRDRDHALTLCTLLGAKPPAPDFARDLRESSRDDIETWGGATAATVLVLWGSDDFSFEHWEKSHVSRLWEEAEMWVGAINSVMVLSTDRQIRVIERLLVWGIELGDPLNVALQLLKAQFAPDLIVSSWKHSFSDKMWVFSFEPHPNLPITRPFSGGQMRSLAVIADSPILYKQKTNLWRLLGLPETSDALGRFVQSQSN